MTEELARIIDNIIVGSTREVDHVEVSQQLWDEITSSVPEKRRRLDEPDVPFSPRPLTPHASVCIGPELQGWEYRFVVKNQNPA